MIFVDATAAMLAYYGLWHVLTGFDLSDAQRATVSKYIATAADAARSGGYVLFPPLCDLPLEPEKDVAPAV